MFMMIAFGKARLHWTEQLLSRIVTMSEQPRLWSVRIQSASPIWFRVGGIRSDVMLTSREHFWIRPREKALAVDLKLDATIQFDATAISMYKLVSGVLIFEVWLQSDDSKADVFAGVVKLPLAGLTSVIESIILQVSPSPLPLLGYSEALPLDDPTSGSICGELSVSVAIGAAEKIMNYHIVSKGVSAMQRKFRSFKQQQGSFNNREQHPTVNSRLSNLESLIGHTLGEIDSHKIMQCWIRFRVPLGLHLHSAEASNENVGQESNGFFWKAIDVSNIGVDVKDDITLLPSTTRTETRLIVHHELISTLQEDPVFLEIGLHTENGDMQMLGTATIPVGDVLTRHTGVQGSFPIVTTSEGAVKTGSRVGVHIFIDQDDEWNHEKQQVNWAATATSTNATAELASRLPSTEDVAKVKQSATAHSSHIPTTTNTDSLCAELTFQDDPLIDEPQITPTLEVCKEADASEPDSGAVSRSDESEYKLSSSEWSQQASDSQSLLSGASETGSLASTVASIHLATKQIDLRLLRLTGQATEETSSEPRSLEPSNADMRSSISVVTDLDPEFKGDGDDEAESVSRENGTVDMIEDNNRMSSPDRSGDHQASYGGLIQESIAVSCIPPGNASELQVPAVADDCEVTTAGDISNPNEAEDDFFYRPLTLASLGIIEVELSTSSNSPDRWSDISATPQLLVPSASPEPPGSGCQDSMERDSLCSQSSEADGNERTRLLESVTSESESSPLESKWGQHQLIALNEAESASEAQDIEISSEEVAEDYTIEPVSQCTMCGDCSDAGAMPTQEKSDVVASHESRVKSKCEPFESMQEAKEENDAVGSESDDVSMNRGETNVADGSDQPSESEEQLAHDAAGDEGASRSICIPPNWCVQQQTVSPNEDSVATNDVWINLSERHESASQNRVPDVAEVNVSCESKGAGSDWCSRQLSRRSEESASGECKMKADSSGESIEISEPNDTIETMVVTASVPTLVVAETQTVGGTTEDAEAQCEQELVCIDAATQTEDFAVLPQLSSKVDAFEHIDEEIQTDGETPSHTPQSTTEEVSRSCQCQITTTESFTQYSRPVSPAQAAIPVEKFDLGWQLLHELRDRIDSEVSVTSRSLNTVEVNRIEESETNEDASHRRSLSLARTGDGPNVVETPTNEHVASEEKVLWDWPDAMAVKTEVERRLPRRQFRSDDVKTTTLKEDSSFSASDPDYRVGLIDSHGVSATLKSRVTRAKVTQPSCVKNDETERIARIMQGTLSYWLGESEEECGDNGSCEEDDSFSSDSDDSFIF
ncbi:hypothetical protein PINS_up001244 [Pythium insidiosum]|nr:hypothetical protein PINS_up001244 [Pythium insidiosum]